MSLEDQTPLNPGSDVSTEVPKKPSLGYSRDFLLSFSSLDICKKLPSGFDDSILREFEDALLSNADRPRTGNLPFLGYRINEHSSSPPTRGDSGNYSRGTYGSRWDSRSSGRSDRDSDSQSDRDSETGRRFDHQHRRPWQTPEHDGLLGSGSFPRPSGHAAGASSKMRTNEQYQLNKSREPYHPPRPYKTVSHSRKDTDAYNDETFGLSESASDDKVEEERRRRASFELIRKEQQKVLQEKQKMNMEKRNASGNSEVTELLGDDGGLKEHFALSNEPEVSASSLFNNNIEEDSFSVQSPASRPVVPPGFANTQEKGSELKSLILPSSEGTKSVNEKSLLDAEVNLMQNGSTKFNVVGQPAETTQPTILSDKFDKEHSQESLDVHFRKLSFKHQSSLNSSQFGSFGNLKHPEITESNTEVLSDKTVGDPKGNESTSILEKIFGTTFSMQNTFSGSVEVDDGKADDVRSHSSVQSSKFAQWFFEEEENNTSDNTSSSRPNDLLSLIVTGDKAKVNSDPLGITNSKEEAIPTVLTCEDLEQSILSEYDTDGKHVQAPFNNQTSNGANANKQSEHVDDHASLQLLSMLQKTTTESDASVRSDDEVKITSELPVSQKRDVDSKVEDDIQSLPDLGRPLTLETLFGTAFMKELQSVGAPVSAQRGPIGSVQSESQEPHGPPYQFPDNDNSSWVGNELQRSGLDSGNRNQTNQIKTGNWLGFNDPQIEIVPSGRSEATSKRIGHEGMFHILSEDDIMSSTDAQNHQMSTFMENDRPDYQIPHQNIRRPQQQNQVWGPFHHLESNSTQISSPANFLGQDSIFNHSSPSERQFHPNMIGPQFHHVNHRFDDLRRRPLLHQMAVGNHPHFPPRGNLVSGHGSDGRVIQEMNNIQGFPLRPPNVHGAHPMPGPAGDVNSGGNPPEAFQRLIAMQLRANSNQVRGNEVDMGFRYR